MADPKPRTALRIETLAAALEQKLDNEAAILDLLVAALARGQTNEALWDQLHAAAQRDDRLAELAFAYERLARDKKLKSLTASAQATVLGHAGVFSADVFGDSDGAEGYLERALTLAPGDTVAFDKYEQILSARKDLRRLGELYASAAPHRGDKAAQLGLLRRGAELVEGDPERALKLHLEILRLDPTEERSKKALEQLYDKTGRLADLAKLLEQAVAQDPPPPPAEGRSIRARLLGLYAGGLGEIERALPHIEEILRAEPTHEQARRVAEELLGHKALTARAAAALGAAFEAAEEPAEAARLIGIEIEALRGPKRLEAQKKLARITLEQLGDLDKTFPMYEAIVPLDPTDDDVRARFVQLSSAIDKQLEATRTLARASTATRDLTVRARINADLGDLYRELADVKKARAAYQAVLDARADEAASLRAARAMAALSREPHDPKALVAALAQLCEVEPEEEARLAAIAELARVSEGELADLPAAIVAHERLRGTKLEADANVALARLYEAAGNIAALVAVLDRMVASERLPARAKDLAFRAADLRSSRLQDRAAALTAWLAYVATYGATREALARLCPLLEQDKRWDELVVALAKEAALAPKEERAPLFARLGMILLARKNDPRAALDAFAQALAIDPVERQTRTAVERMLSAGDLRLAAAELLEPLARAENASQLLVRILETRASLATETVARLAALEEATELSSASLRDPKRAVELATRGLAEALEGALDRVPAWVDRVDALTVGGDAARRATALREALGDRAVDHPAIALLARRVGDALVKTGDANSALVVYRRALAYEPSSPELVGLVDALLRERGSPEERLTLYRNALAQAQEASQRRELRHAIGVLQRRDLQDAAAALATYREALAEASDDRVAFTAVLEIHEAQGAWADLYAELERAFGTATGSERGALLLRLAEVAASHGWLDKAAGHYAEIVASDAAMPDDLLAAAERVARERDDVALLRTVLDRRVSAAIDPHEESTWLTRLAELLRDRIGDAAGAAQAFRLAAASAETAGDSAQAAALLESVLALAPADRSAAERLVKIYRDQGAWARLPPVYAVLLRSAGSPGEAARVLLAFEPHVARAGAGDRFVEEADALLARADELPVPSRVSVRSARARVIAQNPARFADAVASYRSILEAGDDPDGPEALALDALLAARGGEAVAERRWLFAYRAERAPEGRRVTALLDWAAAEEGTLADPAAAADLYGRVVALDPENDAALAAQARLLLAQGAFSEAAIAIDRRRALSHGAARAALDLELAALLLDHLDRPGDALDALVRVLSASPSERAALHLVQRALAAPAASDAARATRRRAAELIEHAAASTEDLELFGTLMDVLLATPADDPQMAASRPAWFARYLDRPGLPAPRALEVALAAASELPGDLALWERAEQLARAAKTPERVAEAYQRVLASADGVIASLSPEGIEELGRRAVEYHEEWFDQPETVISLLRRIVALAPTSSWGFERLKLVFNLNERWDDLFALYDDAIAHARSAAARREMLEDAALAAKDLASDHARATRYYEALYALRPDARVRTALERLYERSGRHRALIDLLETDLADAAKSGSPPPPEAIQRLHARVAGLWLEGVGDADAALASIEKMLAGEPDREEAFELLERLLTRTTGGAVAARRRAAALLRHRYAGEGRAGDRVRILEIELEAAPPAERATLLRTIAKLQLESLHDEGRAFEAVAALLALEPSVAEHRAELGRLSERLGRPARLAEALAAAATAAEGEAKLGLYAQAAEVFELKLGDVSRAIDLNAAILSAGGGDQGALVAARKLRRLLAAAGRTEERTDVLERLAALEPEASARREARQELSHLALESGDTDRAIRTFRAALADEPSDGAAEEGLARALEGAGRWEELVAVLAARAARGGSDEGVRADRVHVARLLEAPIGDVARAIDAWTKMRATFGADDESTDALARLFERTGRLADLVKLLEEEAAATADDGRAADLWCRIGDVHRSRAKKLDDAVAAYDLAFEQRPFHEGARRGLEALLAALNLRSKSTRKTLRAAVASLSRLYGAADDHAAAVALLEPRLAAAASDAERVSVLTETAALNERRAGDPASAFAAILRAFELAPSEVLAARLTRLADVADRWGTVAVALAEGLAARPDVPRAALRELFHRVAQWQRERGDDAAAEGSLKRALALDPESEALLDALAAVQRRTPGRALVETLLRLSAARGGDLEARREAVEVAEIASADPSWARKLADELLDAAAADFTEESAQRAAAWAIEALARLASSPAARSELFLRGASLPFAPPERRRLRLAAAALAEGDLAIALYEDLFSEAPADPEASGRLEQIYKRLDRRTALVSLRARQVAAEPTSERRVALRLDLAALRVEDGDRDGAIAALRENLEEGFHAESIARLSELYEQGGHDAALVELCEERAAAAERELDTAGALSLWTRAAALAEDKLNDAPRAIAAHRRAAALGSAASDDALARLLTARGDHAGAGTVLERICERLEATPGAPGLVPAILSLVEALRSAGRASAARGRLERAARAEPVGGPLRERLTALYRESGEWKALAELFADDAAKTVDRAARVELLREAAEIHLVRQGDPAAAIPLLEQAAELTQDDALSAGVHLRLASARRATGDLDQAAAALRAMLTAYGARRPKERAVVHFELAQVSLAKGERPRAITELDAALRIDPGHPEALHSLARLSLEEGQLERAARTYRALLAVVRRPRGDEPPAPHEVSRAEVLFELAEIARLRGEPERAAEHLESAFEAARESEGERDRLLAALRTRGRHDLLARALEKRLAEATSAEEAAAIQLELAALYEHHLGRIGDALDAKLSALAHAVRTTEALASVLDLARRAGQVERYVAALGRFAESERDEARAVDLHVALGRALEDDLHDDARAAAAYRKAEALATSLLVPDASLLASLWRSLGAVYGRAGDIDAQEALLERRIASSGESIEPTELADGSYQLAALRLRRPGRSAEALELVDRAFAIDPQPTRAAELLRAALAQGADKLAVAKALEHVARASDDDPMLVDALVLLSESDAGAADAIEPLREAFAIAERTGPAELVERLLRKAVALAAAHGDGRLAWALTALASLRATAGDLAEAADLRERAARASDPEDGRALLLEVAAMAAGPLADPERAARLYEELRAREPAEREIWQPLVEVYRGLDDRVRLAALLEETAPLLEGAAERGRLRLERARLAVDEDQDKAVAVLKEVIEDDPTLVEAAVVLAELLEKLGRREELAGLVRGQLDGAKDREDRPTIVRLSLRLGLLLEQQWDEQGALDVYHAALEWDPKSAEVLRQIVRLGMARDDSLSLGDALESLLALEAGDDAVEFALRLAKIRADHADEPGAVEAIERGWQARPGDPRLREELTRRYTESGAFAKLAALCVADAETRTTREERLAGLREAATLLRERAGDDAGAAEILLRALDVEPTNREVLAAVIETMSATSQHARAVDAVGRAIAAAPDDPELYRTRASLHETLGHAQAALLDIEQAYEKSGGEHADALIDALGKAAAACAAKGTPEARAALRGLRLRLAAILAQAGDIDRARGELTELIRVDGRDRTALHALALLEESCGDWAAASSIYARLVALEDGEGLVDTALRLADACERGDRIADARPALERARRVAPDNAAVRDRLREVYTAISAGRELGALLLDDAARTSDPTARFTHLMQAGRLLIAAEGESARAAEVFEQARALRPDDMEATLLLADSYTISARLDDARAVLDGAVGAQRGRRTRALAAVHRRLARLDLAAGDSASALAALTRAFDNDAQNAHLAMELGTLAVELEEHEPATRAFRAVTLMKTVPAGSGEGATAALRALAYYHLGRMAFIQGDKRKARLMIDKAVADDPTLEAARSLLEQLRNA